MLDKCYSYETLTVKETQVSPVWYRPVFLGILSHVTFTASLLPQLALDISVTMFAFVVLVYEQFRH